MLSYLRRLATTGTAYTASSVISKLLAVLLLPLYTRYLSRLRRRRGDAGRRDRDQHRDPVRRHRGAAALLLPLRRGPRRGRADGIRVAFLDHYGGRPDRAAPRGPISEALLDTPDAGLARIAIFGLWIFTLFQYLATLLRVDERARAYFVFNMAGVVMAIPLTVWLVVIEDQGADGSWARSTSRRCRWWRGWSSPSGAGSRWCPTGGCCGACSVRAADDAGGAVAVLAQLHRPDHHRAPRRARRSRPVRAGDQVRPGDKRPRARVPARGRRSPTRFATTTRLAASTR